MRRVSEEQDNGRADGREKKFNGRVTSIPASRDTRRDGTISRFRPLNSLPVKFMKMLLICHCSNAISPPGNQSVMRTTAVLDDAVDRFVVAIDRRFSCSSLLNHEHPHFFGFRSHIMIVSLRKSVSPSSEDILHSGNCIPGVSPTRRRGAQRPLIVA